MTIKAVLFDIGNVIIPWSPENLFRKLIPDTDRRNYFLNTVVPMSWHNAHDAGVTFAENRAPLLKVFPEFTAEIIAYDERFEEMLRPVFAETVAVMDELYAKGVPLYALTNMPTEKADMVFAKSHVFGYFKDIIVSGIERVIKPDPAIYDIALARLGLPASEIFFTDDSRPNIAVASDKGFVTHWFDDPKTLRPALVAANIL